MIMLLSKRGVVHIQAKKLKEYIIADDERIYSVLDAAGFHDIWKASDSEIRCATPDGDNKTGVMVKLNKDLYTAMFSSDYSGDLFGAIQRVRNTNFADTMVFIHNVLGLPTGSGGKTYTDPLGQLRGLSAGGINDRQKENKKYTEAELGTFIPLPHKSLIEEGISPRVTTQFNICFDPELNRMALYQSVRMKRIWRTRLSHRGYWSSSLF